MENQMESSNAEGNVRETPQRASKKKGKKKVAKGRSVAKKMVDFIRKDEKEKSERAATPEVTGVVYYMACSNWHPGIFFNEKPGAISATDWWSSYKEADAAWPPGADITCQVCGVKLDFTEMKDGRKVPFRRRLKSMPAERVDAYAEGASDAS